MTFSREHRGSDAERGVMRVIKHLELLAKRRQFFAPFAAPAALPTFRHTHPHVPLAPLRGVASRGANNLASLPRCLYSLRVNSPQLAA